MTGTKKKEANFGDWDRPPLKIYTKVEYLWVQGERLKKKEEEMELVYKIA